MLSLQLFANTDKDGYLCSRNRNEDDSKEFEDDAKRK
jgi:hypothetical protein